MLESLGIKLSGSVACLTGVSSRAVLDAMIHGERDPQVHAQYAQRRMRSRIAELVEALTGRFTHHHAFLTQLYRDEIDMHTRTVDPLTERIEAAIKPFESAREAFARIPSLSASAADVIIAQTSADMTVFPDAAHLASWAEGCPPADESAGPIKLAKTMPGNKYPKGSTGYRCLGCLSPPLQLPGCEVSTSYCLTWPGKGCRRFGTRHIEWNMLGNSVEKCRPDGGMTLVSGSISP
jgi:transposase